MSQDAYFRLLNKKEQLFWCRFGISPKETPTEEEKVEFERIDKILTDDYKREKAEQRQYFLDAAICFERIAETETDATKKAELLESAANMRKTVDILK